MFLHYRVSPGLAHVGKYQVSFNWYPLNSSSGSSPGWRNFFFLSLSSKNQDGGLGFPRRFDWFPRNSMHLINSSIRFDCLPQNSCISLTYSTNLINYESDQILHIYSFELDEAGRNFQRLF